MSITVRFIVGSLIFASLTVASALVSLQNQSGALELTSRMHSAFAVPLDRLYAARSTTNEMQALLQVGTDASSVALDEAERNAFVTAVRSIRSDIETVLSASLSDETIAAISQMRYPLSRMNISQGGLSHRAALEELSDLSRSITKAVQTVRTDLALLEAEAEHKTETGFWHIIAVTVSGIVALAAFTFLIVRAVRGAVKSANVVAGQIGTGDWDAIPPRRTPGEFRALFRTLAELNEHCTSMAETMEDRSKSLNGQLETKQDQMGAALNNMTQALCMLDGKKKLLVANENFYYYFGQHEIGTPASKFLLDSRLSTPLPRNETSVMTTETARGEIMEVKRRGMADRGLLITFEDITERQQIAEQIEHLAAHDGLTDLPNRHNFVEAIENLLSKKRGEFALAVLDLHNFKAINDNFGHPVGDHVLKDVGERLTDMCGSRAMVARLGGDEFGILIAGSKETGWFDQFIARAMGSFEKPFEIEDRRISVGPRLGVVHLTPNNRPSNVSADMLLQNCDLALYEAQKAEKAAWKLFDQPMRDRQIERREMEVDLRAAIENDELELFYQPFIDTNRNAVSGFEALLRWRHPEKGMISPGVFVPLAEETGLIEEIGVWCLQKACREAATWLSDMTISVNMSPIQFSSTTLIRDVDDALQSSGLDPKRLQIEVTESLFIDEGENILEILNAFRKRGLTISMDDFGTGYSSLGYLSRFPFDKIKIDQSFVRDLSRPENIAIVRSVIGLSKALDMDVLAEGIETREQMDILYNEGCREMQGYFFARPMPAAELPAMIAEITSRWTGDLRRTSENEPDAYEEETRRVA